MARKQQDDGSDERGHGFDLAAIAAERPVLGSDSSNGVVDRTEDRVDDAGSEWGEAFRRAGQANIAGLGGF